MTDDQLQHLIEEATFDYSIGDNDAALEKLGRATSAAPTSFAAWHALAEVNFSLRRFDAALAAAEKAHALAPQDLFINTTLSRIYQAAGMIAEAEAEGGKARILDWKRQLKEGE